jgi:hypothetical protein
MANDSEDIVQLTSIAIDETCPVYAIGYGSRNVDDVELL